MKLSLSICLFIASQATKVLAATAAPGENFLDGRADLRADAKVDAVTVCGNLGVNDEIPDGADKSQYGLCKEHPLGHLNPTLSSVKAIATNETASDERTSDDKDVSLLGKRACWHGRAHGCSNEYCWRRCGADWNWGYWCWMSTAPDNHVWVKCSVDGQCGGWEPRHCSGGCSC